MTKMDLIMEIVNRYPDWNFCELLLYFGVINDSDYLWNRNKLDILPKRVLYEIRNNMSLPITDKYKKEKK